MIVASQLVGKVELQGADTAEKQLKRVGEKSGTTQRDLDKLKAQSTQTSETLAGRFSSALRGVSSRLSEASEKVRSTFAESLRGAGGHILDFTSKIGLATIGIQSMVQGIISLAGNLLKPAADLEQVRSSLITFTGSTKKADDELRSLFAFAAKTPFDTTAIEDAALKMQGVGIAEKNVEPYILALGDALDAMGKTSQEDLSELVDGFLKIKTSGHLTGEAIEAFTSKGIDIWKVLEQQTGKTQAQLQLMVSQGLYPADQAMRDLTRGLEASPLYHGQMANDANVFNGAVSTLTSSWQLLMTKFADPVLKNLTPIIAGITAKLTDPGIAGFAQNVGKKIADIFQTIAGFVQNNVIPAVRDFANFLGSPQFQSFAGSVGTGIANAFQTIGNVASAASPYVHSALEALMSLASNKDVVIAALAGIGAIVSLILIPAFAAWAAEVVMATWPILAVGLAVAGLVAIFKHFYDTNAGFRGFIDGIGHAFQQAGGWIQANFVPAMQQVGNFLGTYVMPILQQIGSFVVSTFLPVWQQLQQLWSGQILPMFQQLWGALQPALPAFEFLGKVIGGIVVIALANLVGIIQGVIAAIGTVVSDLASFFGGLVQFVTGIVQFISGIVRFFYDLFTGNFSKLGSDLGAIWQGILNMFGGVFQAIGSLIHGFFGGIISFIGGFIQGVIGFFQHLFDMLVGHSIIPDMINGIIGFFASLPGKIFGFVVNLVSGAIARFNDFKNKAFSAFHAIVDGIGKIMGNIGNSIWGAIKGALNTAIDFINGFISGLNKIHVDIGDVHLGVNIPLIPHLAKGTSFFQGGPAVVGEGGEPELVIGPHLVNMPRGSRVVPISQLQGGSQTIVVNVAPAAIELDGYRFAGKMMPHMVNQLRGRGITI